MKLTNEVSEMILTAESKALATSTSDTINVVPVSTIKIIDNKIILINYFMGKTLENIQRNPKVALTCWKGLEGYQVKGIVEYVESGELYNDMTVWIKEILPQRVVKGILILIPEKMFNISATAEYPGKEM